LQRFNYEKSYDLSHHRWCWR